LEDGSVVATHQDAKLARDGQDRIYRENVTRFPANIGQKSRVKEIITSILSLTPLPVTDRWTSSSGEYQHSSVVERIRGPERW
jgi:hypothetical protein